MHKIYAYIIIIFILAASLYTGPVYTETPGHKHVLYISSYHPGFPTFFQQVEGIKSVFKGMDITLDIEFMDTKRFPSAGSVNMFHRMLSWKLAGLPRYDAVIAADDAALQFAVGRRNSLFRGVPVFFCGINDPGYVKSVEKIGQYTGTVEAVSMKETLILIKSVFPARKKLAVISDGTIPGRADMVNFMREQAGIGFDIKVLSLEHLSFEEFNAELDSLDNDSVILLLSAYTDRTGSTRLFRDEFMDIMRHTRVPVFHLYEHGLGDGVFGGKIISHYEQARTAAGFVLRYFNGEPVGNLKIIYESPNRYMFDYIQLERFGISLSDLPEGSIVINRPHSFIELHPQVMLGGGLGIFFLAAIIMIQLSTRKKLEHLVKSRTDELVKSNERLHFALENAKQVIWEWNIESDEFILIKAGDRAAGQVSNGRVMKSSEWSGRIHPDDVEKTAESMERLLSGSTQVYEIVNRIKTFDDAYRWFMSYGTISERDPSGRILQLSGISTDITQLKEIESEISRARSMLRMVLDTIPMGVFWKGTDLAYMGCNNIFAGYARLDSPADIIGKRDADLVWKDNADMHEAIDMTIIAENRPTGFYEEEIISPAGKVTVMRKLKAPLAGLNGEVVGILGIQEDVTAARRMREQRVRMQKLESVGILAGGLAHDFNNMLMAISGSLSVLHLHEKDEKKLKWITQAQKSCAAAAEVTSRLITFARGGDPVIQPFDASALIRTVVELDNAGAEPQVSCEIHEDIPDINGDERQIGQVLRNLLENAREAVAEGGSIHVRYSMADSTAVSSAGLKEGRYVQLSVRDTGKGMGGDILGKIFDPYFSTKDMGAQKGQGLGLTVCHSIVKNHGGAVIVDSKPGQGSVFTVFLPVRLL